MTRWKLTVEYDGAAFCGWQKQLELPTVQQAIEEAIFKFSGEAGNLIVAGRTDTGVHARAQVAHFDLARETTGDVVRNALNNYLRPQKVVILNAEAKDETFHARFSALGRSYRYRIINRPSPLALDANYAWHISKELNIPAMQHAASLLLGQHDFSTFRALDCQANSPIRTLDRLDITKQGEEVTIFAAARSFLHHQVRNMVGTLKLVGNDKWTIDDFTAAFAACDRTRGGPNAPPQGLCFWEVTYPEN
jgi:tRNA pseudouridine38-40 synthase